MSHPTDNTVVTEEVSVHLVSEVPLPPVEDSKTQENTQVRRSRDLSDPQNDFNDEDMEDLRRN